jgi:hypothetical protein
VPTLDDVSRIAASLPGSVEKASGGGTAWFVRRKPFAWEAMPWPSQEDRVREIVAGEPCLGVTVPQEDDKRALAQMEPGVFVASETKWGGPKIIIRLGAVDARHLTELIEDSWRMQAPKYLRREFDEGRDG